MCDRPFSILPQLVRCVFVLGIVLVSSQSSAEPASDSAAAPTSLPAAEPPASSPAALPFFPPPQAPAPAAQPMLQPIPRRTVELTTVVTLPPQDAPARVWVPIPLQSSVQELIELAVQAPANWTIEQEPVHGNRFLYVVAPPSPRDTIIRWTAVVRRRQWIGPEEDGTAPGDLAKYTQSTLLVPTGHERLTALLETATAGVEPSTAPRARAIFDFVRAEMEYDKSGTGWGRGDVLYACNAKKGNCTDYHALFNGLARTAGIPARFTMGLSLPPEPSGPITGYHCWTAYWLEGRGWIPVDASEADKHPEVPPTNYYTRLDEHRVAISRGRDIVLAPPQDGPVLNYAWDPYVEIQGEPVQVVTTRRTYRTLTSADLIFRKALR